MGAGKGWSQHETKTACRAYIVISEDPRRGSGRKKDVFVAAVLEEYKRLIPEVQCADGLPHVYRTGDAICQRFRKARAECLKYESILKQIRNRKPTGSPSNEDINRAALAIYNGESTIGQMYTFLRGRTVDGGSEFQFKEALDFLRSTHTWNLLLESQRDSEKNQLDASAHLVDEINQRPDDRERDNSMILSDIRPSDTPVNDNENTDPVAHSPASKEKAKRPIGKKRALDNSTHAAALHKGANAIERLAQASAKRTKLAEDMLKVEEERSMIDLFSMPDTNPELKKKFMELSQLKALAKLQSQISTQQTSSSSGPPSSQEKDNNNVSDTSTNPSNIVNLLN